jgi:hypothetical protein
MAPRHLVGANLEERLLALKNNDKLPEAATS